MRFKTKTAACAVQGRDHAAAGIPCQDRVFTRRLDGRSAIVALADGAGSCGLSHIGAEFVTASVGGIIHSRFEDFFGSPSTAASEIVDRLQAGLSAKLSAASGSLADCASTLLFACIRRRRRVTRYISGHIGDGFIAILADRSVRVLSHPERGEFSNTTYFVTLPNAAGHLRIFTGTVYGDMGFLLASDGAAEALYRRRDGALGPACAIMLGWLSRLSQRKVGKALQKNMDHVFRLSTTDDCSIALLRTVG
jgi:hypothetical protein